ncbi:MAG: hypothetical protein H8E76_03105 [Helicobacteraceae bacterium]|nr:hypothetical protein [Candidatus Sulfurimonas ponti]MBL6973004.1 hypothetical protein [Sulfurimonas sp.]
MFDFLDSDWFIITLEIVFVILIAYDIKKYIETKKKEYITNIVLTLGFAIWTLYPMYTSYFGWEDKQKQEMLLACNEMKDVNATKLCNCVDETIFKNFTYKEFSQKDTNSKEYQEFMKEAKEDCLDDGWF